MRVLVCGDRNWTDRRLLEQTLTELHAKTNVAVLIEGEARGADTMGAVWAYDTGGIELMRFPADWARYGRAAGVLRNQQMLDEGHPDLVLAFHDDLEHSRGTADMVRRARGHKIPVRVVTHE